ncbi:SRP-less Sec system protein [Leptospira wolffii]|uniref:SRP-less Sec system protein n=1 Tax=Leptospira wolffii TaxID=409998 RepID=UPI0003534F00|nr:SRP-less Sec system protein [Leptospira wolffii]EPG67406.1 Sec region non-globular protein [Leptospira wolffii serovar Khorat str. Khorat-H2]
MKKILCLLISFALTFSLFSQDGEEIDFLDKVSEPKKSSTASKQGTNAKTVKKKKGKKGAKKKKGIEAKKEELAPKDGEPKKKIETDIPPEDPDQGKNSGDPSGSEKALEKTSARDLSANTDSTGEPQKPYWLNEETRLTPNHLPGYDASATAAPQEDHSIREKLGEILKIGQDKKKEEEKRKAAEQKDQGVILGFFSEYKKGIIILTIVVAFALYQIRTAGRRTTKRSPVTINKVRRD